MRPLLLALVTLLAACNGAPPPDAASDASAEAPLCAVGATEQCGCARVTGYRRCVDGSTWSACFCEELDDAADLDDAPTEVGLDVSQEVGADAPSIDPSDAAADADAACETRCDGACVDTGFDPFNCGACGTRCTTGVPHTRAQCFGGRCETPCQDGYRDCNSNAADGCETNVNGTDRANCGACRNQCGGAQVCTAGTCRIP